MVLEHNIFALNATRNLNINTHRKNVSTEKLSTGYRINKAADDASGLAITEAMRGQVRGLNQAGRNSMDGQSLISTADAAMNEVNAVLQRMRELCVQGANDTYTSIDRQQIQEEIDALNSEIDRIANETEFNTIKILRGSYAGIQNEDLEEEDLTDVANNFVFQIGADTDQVVDTYLPLISTKILGTNEVNVSGTLNATNSLDVIDDALVTLNSERSRIGAISNRLDHAYVNVTNSSENTQHSESIIRETNMAKEMVEFAVANILEQSGISMAAQGNSSKDTILKMLQ